MKAIALFMSLLLMFFGNMPEAWAADFTDQVLEVIRSHPEIVIEAQKRYWDDQEAQKQQKIKEQLDHYRSNPISFTATSPATGPLDHAITVVEFADFQCPYCATAHRELKALLAANSDRLTLVYKFLPLVDIHKDAMAAAKAAWAAAQQGKFWQYHDALYEHQLQLGESLYVNTANELGLNIDRFNRDRASDAAQRAIVADIQLAAQLQVWGTPALLIKSGDSVQFQSLSYLKKLL